VSGELNAVQSPGYADASGHETVAEYSCAPGCVVAELGRQSGETRNGGQNDTSKEPNRGMFFQGRTATAYAGDTGTCARFFPQLEWCDDDAPPGCGADFVPFRYQAKAGRAERDAGLEGFREKEYRGTMGKFKENPGRTVQKGGGRPARNPHPCQKPLSLTKWLAALVKPPDAYLDDATLLIPFSGAGSECVGAYLAGWRNVVGIEISQEYCDIAEARIACWRDAMETTGLDDPKAILAAMKKRKPAPLLDLVDEAAE